MDRHILLAEDNSDEAALTIRAFRQGNVHNPCVVVSDGPSAVSHLLGHPAAARPDEPPPALVLLDLNLPKLDGLEVLRRLRADERTRGLPVVVLSSSRDEREVAAAYRAGANSYVRKPIDSSEFARVMRQIVEYWLRLNETVA